MKLLMLIWIIEADYISLYSLAEFYRISIKFTNIHKILGQCVI